MLLLSLKTTSMRVEQTQMTGESASLNKFVGEFPKETTENIIQP